MLLVDVIPLLLQVEIYISPLDDNAKTLEKKNKNCSPMQTSTYLK